MEANKKTLGGSARTLATTTIVVGINEEAIDFAAKVAALAILRRHEQLKDYLDALTEFNKVALKAVLNRAADEDAQVPRWVKIPSYCDSMIVGLEAQLGRTYVRTKFEAVKYEEPASYKDAYGALRSIGVTCAPLRRLVETKSKTLALDVDVVDGVATVIGDLDSVALEDCVRRSLLKVEGENREVLRRLCGELSLQYGEVDMLLTDFFTAEAGVNA